MMNDNFDPSGRSGPQESPGLAPIEPLATGKALDAAVNIANRLALGLPPAPVAPAAPPTPAPTLEGFEKTVRDVQARFPEVKIAPGAFVRESDGMRVPKTLFGKSIVHPAVTTAEFYVALAREQNVTLLPSKKVALLHEIEAEGVRLCRQLEKNGFTTEHAAEIIAQDETLNGKPGHMGLTNHDHERLYAIIGARLNVIKNQIKENAAKGTPAYLELGGNLEKVLELSLLSHLESEMKEALRYNIGFSPSLLTVTIDSALAQVRDQILELSQPLTGIRRDAFSGVLALLK